MINVVKHSALRKLYRDIFFSIQTTQGYLAVTNVKRSLIGDADSEACHGGDKCEVKDVVEEQSNTLKRQEAGR